VEEQLALLREREPAPAALPTDLGRRRIEATRERLVTVVEAIPAARPTVQEAPPGAAPRSGPAAPAPEATGEGRIEVVIVVGE
jgi:hypothetical protein